MSTSELFGPSSLRVVALLCLAVAVFVVAHELALVQPVVAPAYGLRGKRRSEARNDSLFVLCEPILMRLAGWLRRLPLGQLRPRLTLWVRHASEPAGFVADELVALSVLSLCTLGVCAYWSVRAADLSFELACASLLASGYLPIGRVLASARQRAKMLERSLPSAMDLCVLCMGAGADFPAALAFVVAELGPSHEVCRDELAQVLDELALGRTRVEALSALATRTHSVAVRELVSALCQSEEKGTPMIDALTIQSTTLRQRRSVRAEELAAQAGVKMMLPLMLLVASLLLIVFGPIVVTGAGL